MWNHDFRAHSAGTAYFPSENVEVGCICIDVLFMIFAINRIESVYMYNYKSNRLMRPLSKVEIAITVCLFDSPPQCMDT